MGILRLGRRGMAVAHGAGILPPRRRKATAAYIASWIGAAVASILLLSVISAGGPSVDAAEVALFLAVTAVADTLVLRLHHGRSEEFITLLEAAICINIVLFPAPIALGVTLGGSALSHLVHRQHPVKGLFNLAQYAVGAVSAIAIYHLVAGGDPGFGWREVTGLAAGMVCFGAVNSAALSGLVSLYEGRSFRHTFEDGLQLSLLTVLGNTAVGILAAAMWVSNPTLTVLFVAPAATLHLAYRGVVRTRQLLETVESERDRLNRIVMGASDGITLLDADGNIDVWSPAMAGLTGVSAHDALGAPVASALTGAGIDGTPVDLLSPMQNATVDDPTSTVEMVLSHRHGGTRVVRVRHTVLFDTDGSCTGDAVIVHDITREHESERLKDDFLARVSHELRTPLTPIKGYAQTLLRRGGDVPEEFRRDALSSVIGRVDHMQTLIEDLLLVSRIVSGSASLEDQIRPRAVDVQEVCEQVLRSFRVAEPHRDLRLEVSEAFPVTTADPARVDQIVTNLVSNACKYSKDGTPVTVVVRREDDWIAVDVTDRGRGISSHQIESIFERFFRVEDPLTMTTGGVGLGLHISRELAHAMGGSLTAQSTLGRGSKFTLLLPLERIRESVSHTQNGGLGPGGSMPT